MNRGRAGRLYRFASLKEKDGKHYDLAEGNIRRGGRRNQAGGSEGICPGFRAEDPRRGWIPHTRGTARITGIVRDQAGNPGAGVEVQVVPTMRTQREEIRTDASGPFEILRTQALDSDAPPAKPGGAGRGTKLVGSTEIEKDKAEGGLDLTLQPGLTITGTAVSEEGRPLAGGHITVTLVLHPIRFGS